MSMHFIYLPLASFFHAFFWSIIRILLHTQRKTNTWESMEESMRRAYTHKRNGEEGIREKATEREEKNENLDCEGGSKRRQWQKLKLLLLFCYCCSCVLLQFFSSITPRRIWKYISHSLHYNLPFIYFFSASFFTHSCSLTLNAIFCIWFLLQNVYIYTDLRCFDFFSLDDRGRERERERNGVRKKQTNMKILNITML